MDSISRDTRNSSIELLRIICMLFVVAGHVIVFGVKPDWQRQSVVGGTDYIISHALYGMFVTAVDVFVLISGWFSIKFNWKKIKNIWLMLITYSWAFFAYKCVVGGGRQQEHIVFTPSLVATVLVCVSIFHLMLSFSCSQQACGRA